MSSNVKERQIEALAGLSSELDKLNNHLTALNALNEHQIETDKELVQTLKELVQAIKELTIPHPLTQIIPESYPKSTGFSQMKVQKGTDVFECKYKCGTLVRWPENWKSGPPVNATDNQPHQCMNRPTNTN